MDVVIDILDGSHYNSYIIYKGEELFKVSDYNGVDKEIHLGVLPIGNYQMCLVNENETSKPVYWIVADYSVQITTISPGKIKVAFSSSNATPLWITWRRPHETDALNNNMPYWTTVIDESSSILGYIESELDPFFKTKYGSVNWEIKVAYETEYGIISSDSIHL